MRKLYKAIFKDFIIFAVIFGMMFNTTAASNLSEIIKENCIAFAADGGFDYSNPTASVSGIMGDEGYKKPPIKVSLWRSKTAAMEGSDGKNKLYDKMASGYPTYGTPNQSSLEGSFYISNMGDSAYNKYFKGGTTPMYEYKYDPSSGQMIRSSNFQFMRVTGSSKPANGVYFTQLKATGKAALASQWKAIATNKSGSVNAWSYITSADVENGNTTFNINKRINEVFNPENYDYGETATWDETTKLTAWYRYLDMLMTLYTVVDGSQKTVWATAIDDYINARNLDTKPVSVVAEQGVAMTFNGRTSLGVLSTIDFIQYACQVDQAHALTAGWKSAANKGNMYNMLLESATGSVQASPQRNATRAGLAGSIVKTNGFSWGLSAMTRARIWTNSTGAYYKATKVSTAYIETMGLSNKAGNTTVYGYSIWPMPLPVSGGGLGSLAATPDNYTLDSNIINTNVTLTLKSGIPEKDLGTWTKMVQAAQSAGQNFTVQVDWTRATTDVTAPASIISNPTILIWTPSEMMEWISGRKTIVAFDSTNGQEITSGKSEATLNYTANITIKYGNNTVGGSASDPATFKVRLERIGYTSTPQAYAEFKNYGVNSNMSGTLSEDFEAMAGVPSTEQMYFAAGGSEFIVDITLNSVSNEVAHRTYNSYFTAVDCEFKEADTLHAKPASVTSQTYNGKHTGSSTENYNGYTPEGAASYTAAINGHTAATTVTATWTGTIANNTAFPGWAQPYVADTYSQSGSCPNMGTSGSQAILEVMNTPSTNWDVTKYNTAVDQALRWATQYQNTNSTYTFQKNGASDNKTRIWKIGNATISISLSGGDNGQAIKFTGTRTYGGGSYTIGNVSNAKLNSSDAGKLGSGWGYTQGKYANPQVIAAGGCPHNCTKVYDVPPSKLNPQGSPHSHNHTCQRWVHNPSSQGSDSKSSDIQYTITVTFSNGTLQAHELCGPCCSHILPEVHDTWAQTSEYDSMEINSVHVWRIDQGALEGLTEIINTDVVGATIVRGEPNIFYNIALKNDPNYKTLRKTNGYGNNSNQATAGRLYYSLDTTQLDVVTYNLGTRTDYCDGLAKTYGTNKTQSGGHGHSEVWSTGFIYTNSSESYNSSNTGNSRHGETASKVNTRNSEGNRNYVTTHTDNKDKATKEYTAFVQKRDQRNTTTMITDFLILQTSSGDQSVMYYQAASPGSVCADQQMYDIELGELSGGGVTKNDYLSGGTRNPISEACWYGNGNSAANWDPHHIGLGSYTGKYWNGASKFNGTSGGGTVRTMFDTKLPNQVMTRPARQNRLMIYKGELNIKLNNKNRSYTTGYSETFWSNQLHWNNRAYTRLDSAGRTIRPYATLAKDTDNAPYATDVTSFMGGKYTYSGKTRHQFGANDFIADAGYAIKSIYTDGQGKCNDMIVHDPVSTEDTALVSLEQYRDQRTGDTVGTAADITNELDKENVCPRDPGLCDYRVLNCTYNKDVVVFNADFDTQKDGKFINTVTGNALKLPSGFSLDRNASMNGVALRCFGTRLSIPFSEMNLSYNTSTHLEVEADITISPNGKGQMIFSFNTFDLYLPSSDEYGKNGNVCLTLNTGNGWEKKVNTPIADGKKHKLKVEFSMAGPKYSKVYIDGVESTYTTVNTSSTVTSTSIGNAINIGSWGYNNDYGAGFWLDNLKITRKAGGTSHTEECYTVVMTHPDGLNAHRHTAACLADDSSGTKEVEGMKVMTYDGKTWGRVFYHNTAGGFFTSEAEAQSTNQVYKYSVLNQIQNLKLGDKYQFMLYYPETGQRNIWKQSKRPQDDIISDTAAGTGVATGYEPVSIGMNGNYWGGLTKSTSGATYLDGSVGHGNWFYAIGSYSKWGTGRLTIPGGNETSVNVVELWLLISDDYRTDTDRDNAVFGYTGGEQTYVIPSNGYYKLEAWGASGGLNYYNNNGGGAIGQGGYTSGTTYMTKGTVLHIYVGQQGYNGSYPNYTSGTFNGGGAGMKPGYTADGHQGGAGGGASDIRLVGGAWNNTSGLRSRILVAGGGGGVGCASVLDPAGNGGGLNGGTSYNVQSSYTASTASGGTQTTGGSGYSPQYNSVQTGLFGVGAYGSQCGSGGGGGYYGGGSAYTAGGGGGSSYVTGHAGCDTTYRANQGGYNFTNVILQQGGNVGNGQVRITKLNSLLDDISDGINNGTMSEAQLRDYLGNAYDYIKAAGSITTLYTYSDWYTQSNGFYNLASSNVTVNEDGTFLINNVSGYECGLDAEIDGSALRYIDITYIAGKQPDNGTGISINSASQYFGATSVTTNANGETVATIDLGNKVSGTTIRNIWFDLGAGASTGKMVGVKEIKLRGYGTASTTTRAAQVKSSTNPGLYNYTTNAFGATNYNVALAGAGGGNSRKVNEATVVAGSGGAGATIAADKVFSPKTNLTIAVGGKGYDQASTAANGGISSWNNVVYKNTPGYGSYTLLAGHIYYINMLGASGGSGSGYGHTTGSTAGYGGYSSGVIRPSTNMTVYYYVGGAGGYGAGGSAYGGPVGGYNGGGNGGNSGSGSGGGATHIATANGLLSQLSGNRGSILLVAGGGGGTDDAGSSPGGGNDGSGGNGGGTTSQGAWIDGSYHSEYGATLSSGYAFGQGESVGSSTDSGGAGGGYYGGRATHHYNGGAGGGSGYVNTSYMYTLDSAHVATTGGSTHVGNGVITIAEAIMGTNSRIDGSAGYNGGGSGGREYEETYPESAAGGGGATDLSITGDTSKDIEVYKIDNFSDWATTTTGRGTPFGNGVSGEDVIVTGDSNVLTVSKRWTDGWIYLNKLIGKDLTSANCIELRIKPSNKDATTHEFYFVTDNVWVDSYKVKFEKQDIVDISTDGYVTYRKYISPDNVGWGDGPITTIRCDFDNGVTSGTYYLDYIRFINTKGNSIMTAGGGGGAGSEIPNAAAYGGNGGLMNGTSTNAFTSGGTQSSGFTYGKGQNGADGASASNTGAIGGAGGGYYGGKIIRANNSSIALGGAGGSSYIGSGFKLTGKSLSNHGNGAFSIYEYRETLIIKNTNYAGSIKDQLMKYYTLIPDKLGNGTDNPIWENCTKTKNYHQCNANCKETKVLTCTEPHHSGVHYDVSNKICWQACENDANHKIHKNQIQADISFKPGNFINLDYGFSIYFPNRGNFNEGEQYALGGLTSARGRGFINTYLTNNPYGRGTANSASYVGKGVGMNTSKWTRVKRIKFTIDVIYDNKLYLANEWIYLGDRGTYTGSIGGVGNDKKYDETKWSNYGTKLYDGIYKEYYDFYCPLENSEAKGASYTIEVTALNADAFNSSGDGQINDNTGAITNKARTSSYTALHGGTNMNYYDVVGRIGNLIMEDVEDFRFSNLFKEAADKSTATDKTVTNSYSVTNGLGIADRLNTANTATKGNKSVTTNATGAYAVVNYKADNKYYKVTVEGNGLNAGRLAVVNSTKGLADIDYGKEIPDSKFTIISSSANKVSYYVDLSKYSGISDVDVKYIAKASNAMAITKITISKLGSTPDKWLLDGVIREVDETKQNIYLSWVADIRGIKVSEKTHWLDTWGTLGWMNGNRLDFPLSPEKNNIDILKDEPMLTGYSAYLDIQSMGNYWQNDISRLQIIPKYYAIDLKTNGLIQLDAYMEHDGAYQAINLYNNVDKNSANIYKQEIYKNTINLDWLSEKARRNVSAEEERKTQFIYTNSLVPDQNANKPEINGDDADASVDWYRPIDIPGGHVNTIGTNQYLVLDGNARTFVGGESTYGQLKNIGNRVAQYMWYRQAQRWHFSIGLPSSTVFVRHGQDVTSDNIIEVTDGDYIVICALNIVVVGNTYALRYQQKYSGSVANDAKGTDSGTTDGTYLGSVKVKDSNGVSHTLNLNNYAKDLDYDPIVFVYNPSANSGQDVEIIGTH